MYLTSQRSGHGPVVVAEGRKLQGFVRNDCQGQEGQDFGEDIQPASARSHRGGPGGHRLVRDVGSETKAEGSCCVEGICPRMLKLPQWTHSMTRKSPLTVSPHDVRPANAERVPPYTALPELLLGSARR